MDGFVLIGLGVGSWDVAMNVGGSTVLALAGAALWGLGTSLGFPAGISAAADDPVRAAARVSVLSSIGYAAFLRRALTLIAPPTPTRKQHATHVVSSPWSSFG